MHGFVTSWENVLFTLENIGLLERVLKLLGIISLASFLHKVKSFSSIMRKVWCSYYCCPPLSRKRGEIKSHSSVRLSVCHKNFNLGHNFCTITDRALILGMCILCDKTFQIVPCRDLDCDL